MNATVSPVRLMSPAALRWGVWRSPAVAPSGPAATNAAGTPGWRDELRDEWRAEWRLVRQAQVPMAVLSRWWWMASVLGALAVVGVSLGMVQGAHHTGNAVTALLLLSGLARWLLWVHARHADDHDHIAMHAERVHVACQRGGRTASFDCHPRWVRIEPVDHDRSLIRVSGEGASMVVGEFVMRDERKQLAHELRWALRQLDDR